MRETTPTWIYIIFFFSFSFLLFIPFFFFFSFTFFILLLFSFPSKFTPFCAPSVPETPPISLGLPQLYKHSSIPKVHSWPHLLLSLTTTYPSGPKVGCKKPITWPKTGPSPCLGLIWGGPEQSRIWAPKSTKIVLHASWLVEPDVQFPTG